MPASTQPNNNTHPFCPNNQACHIESKKKKKKSGGRGWGGKPRLNRVFFKRPEGNQPVRRSCRGCCRSASRKRRNGEEGDRGNKPRFTTVCFVSIQRPVSQREVLAEGAAEVQEEEKGRKKTGEINPDSPRCVL